MDVAWSDPVYDFLYYHGAHRLAEQDGQTEADHNEDPLEALFDHDEYYKENQGNLPQIKIRKKGDNPIEQWMGQLQVKKTQKGGIYIQDPVHCSPSPLVVLSIEAHGFYPPSDSFSATISKLVTLC